MFGLSATELEKIISVLKKYSAIKEALIFGSRALNTNHPGSDIDLALKGIIDLDTLASVKAELEALPMPYFFDVVNYSTISNPDLKEHIDKLGKTIL